MHLAKINGVTLAIDTLGDEDDPALLLIMGGAASMDRWEDPFCARLAEAGRYVIRYDHRDTGASTTWPPGEPGYAGEELLADAVGVLDHLGVARSHVAGMSMGAAIAQEIAVLHPERVRTLTLLSTTSAGSGGPELPGVSPGLAAAFASEEQPPPPDWADREAAVAYLLEAERLYAGARGLDEEATREVLSRVLDRSPSPGSGDNHFMLGGEALVTHEQIAGIRAPTLVIHGTHDPLFPTPHGEALAAAIPGAELLLVEGLGHELPRWAWDDILPALIAHTAER